MGSIQRHIRFAASSNRRKTTGTRAAAIRPTSDLSVQEVFDRLVRVFNAMKTVYPNANMSFLVERQEDIIDEHFKRLIYKIEEEIEKWNKK